MGDKITAFLEELNAMYAEHSPEEIERFLLVSSQKLKKEKDLRMLCTICHELGAFYRLTKHYAQSLSVCERSVELTVQEFGEGSVQHASALCNLAETYRVTGRYEEAEELYDGALAIYRDLNMQYSYIYANVLQDLSHVYMDIDKVEEAITCLEIVSDILITKPECAHERVITYNNLAALSYKTGNREEAMHNLNLALIELDACANIKKPAYMDGLNSIAGLLFAQGENEKALEVYRKSANYVLRFYGKSMEYAEILHSMYWIYRETGNTSLANDILIEVKEIYEENLDPDSERMHAIADEMKNLRRVSAAQAG